MLYYERKLKKVGCSLIIGVDEAGRGPLAGPVVACAVTLRSFSFAERIDDSKKLTPRQRESAFREIIKKSDFSLGIISEKDIDRRNILVATCLAMEEAVNGLMEKVCCRDKNTAHVLVDGNLRLNLGMPYTNIIGGDSRSKSIACASILAKVLRDRIMCIYDKFYPQYGFMQHKGYPTKGHFRALERFGVSRIHRLTFCGV